MIETYGVDVAPAMAEELYESHAVTLAAFKKERDEYLASQREMETVNRVLSRFADVVSTHTLATRGVISVLKGEGDAIPIVSILKGDLAAKHKGAPVMTLGEDLLNWYSQGAKLMKGFKEVFDTVAAEASERADYVTRKVNYYNRAVDLMQCSLDLYLLEYVFGHSESKYKKKICKECVKVAKSVVSASPVVLKELENLGFEEEKKSKIASTVRKIVAAAENRRRVFSDLKTYIDEKGVEEAMSRWENATRRKQA